MLIGWLGFGAIGAILALGWAAIRDPESGLGGQPLDQTLLCPLESMLDQAQAEVWAIIQPEAERAGFHVMARVRLSTVFAPARMQPTGWHRVRHAPLDFVLVRHGTFAPAGVILLEGGEATDYLEAENRQMKEDALIESGVPILKVDRHALEGLPRAWREWLARIAPAAAV